MPSGGETFRAFLMFEHDFPVSLTNATKVVMLVVEVRAFEGSLLAVPNFREVDAVEAAVGRDLGTGERGDRR